MAMYESIIIFKGDLTEEEVESKEKEYLHKIVHSDHPSEDDIPTSVHEIRGLGKKKLAYDVKGYSDGWYSIFTYQTEIERIQQLERIMKADDTVLKFISMRLGEDAVAKIDTSKVLNEQPTVRKVRKPKEVDAFDLIFGEVS